MTVRPMSPIASGDLLPPQDRLPELGGTRTHDSLRAAHARDAQVTVLYRAFARLAEIEGLPEVARTLKEAAELRDLEVLGHLDLLRRAGDPLSDRPMGETTLNLGILLELARWDTQGDLSEAARTAHGEGFADVASWFETLGRARSLQSETLKLALAAASGEDRS